MKVHVSFEAALPYKIDKKGKWFISSCPILDVFSQGDTKEKAKENLVEALSLFFVSCFERGTLDEVLKECGFKALTKKRKAPKIEPKLDIINVPIPFEVNTKPAECRA